MKVIAANENARQFIYTLHAGAALGDHQDPLRQRSRPTRAAGAAGSKLTKKVIAEEAMGVIEWEDLLRIGTDYDDARVKEILAGRRDKYGPGLADDLRKLRVLEREKEAWVQKKSEMEAATDELEQALEQEREKSQSLRRELEEANNALRLKAKQTEESEAANEGIVKAFGATLKTMQKEKEELRPENEALKAALSSEGRTGANGHHNSGRDSPYSGALLNDSANEVPSSLISGTKGRKRTRPDTDVDGDEQEEGNVGMNSENGTPSADSSPSSSLQSDIEEFPSPSTGPPDDPSPGPSGPNVTRDCNCRNRNMAFTAPGIPCCRGDQCVHLVQINTCNGGNMVVHNHYYRCEEGRERD